MYNLYLNGFGLFCVSDLVWTLVWKGRMHLDLHISKWTGRWVRYNYLEDYPNTLRSTGRSERVPRFVSGDRSVYQTMQQVEKR